LSRYLSDKTAVEDFENELPAVLGDTEAELLKLSTNFYYGMKVVFFNLLYDLCMKSNLDYESIKSIW
jgi:UDP-glucose 6-dehydrogenase